MDERRAHKRVALALEVEITHGGEGWMSLSTNLSLGGLRLKSPTALRIGDQIEMVLHLGEETLPLSGRVVWRSAEANTCGIEFDPLPGDARDRLQAHMDSVGATE